MKIELERNKSLIVQKWKLNNIIIESNWSLKTSNAYMVGLLN